MRRLYADLVWRRVRGGDLRFPLRALASVARAALGDAVPLLGTLVVTYRCDLDCAMCDLPTRGDRARELDARGLGRALDAMRDLGVLGVGVTGGEPLLRRDLFEVLAHGSRIGLLVHVNTNGSLVDAAAAEAFARCGVASVNVSLDGPDAATHDRLRRRPGSFARVLRAAARLCAVPGRPFRVALTCALGEGNVERAEELLERARDLGVDRVGFLPVHDYGPSGVARVRGAAEAVAALAARAGKDPLLDNSPEYLALFATAYAGGRNPVPCAAPRTSIVVDCYGEVFPCVPIHARRKGAGSGELRRVWRSRAYGELRARLSECRACFWNCHTEMNLALARLGGRT